MKVLGIDPGSHITGYGVVERERNSIRHIDNGGIFSSSKLKLAARLCDIFTKLTVLIDNHRPDAIAIENLFVAKNARSSLMLGHARGVALVSAARAGVPIWEYTPSQVKQAVVGQGSATKHQIQHMVRAILGLPEIAQEDASDALAVAICHCQTSEFLAQIERALEKQ